MVEYAVFLLVVGHAMLTLLTLGPRVAALTQALVGLHTHSSIAAGWFTLGNSAEGSLPAGAAAALASRSAVSVLTVSGTSCHQQLWRLHLTLALFRGVRSFRVNQLVEFPTV